MSQYPMLRAEVCFREGESFLINRCDEGIKGTKVSHTHDFLEICYVCAGSGYHEVDGQTYKVTKGDLFIINYDVPHVFYKAADGDQLVTNNINFTPGYLDENLSDLHDFNSLAMSFLFRDILGGQQFGVDLRLSREEQRDFDLLIGSMYQEYTMMQSGYKDIMRAYVIVLLTKIMRCFSSRGLPEAVPSKKINVVQEALDHLRAHYNEPISLNELAMKSFFSKNYFCRLFKEVTGTTISQFVYGVRIDEAINMLRTTDKTVSQIALEVGFADNKLFTQAFKKYTGCSPGRYRKNAVG